MYRLYYEHKIKKLLHRYTNKTHNNKSLTKKLLHCLNIIHCEWFKHYDKGIPYKKYQCLKDIKLIKEIITKEWLFPELEPQLSKPFDNWKAIRAMETKLDIISITKICHQCKTDIEDDVKRDIIKKYYKEI